MSERPHDARPVVDEHMRKSYVRVLLVWVLTLAGLYAFQTWFS